MLPRSASKLVLVVALLLATLPMMTATAEDDRPFELVFPHEMDVTTFHNDWRARRSGGRRHNGNDLMAPKLSEVYAAADGQVVKVATSRRAGRYLIIEHRDGWETYYIHLNNDNPGTDDGDAPWSLTLAAGVEEGSLVSAGQLIGFVGDSGNAEGSGPHTHFELHHNGRAVNPHDYLVAALQRAIFDAERETWLDNSVVQIF